MSKGSKNKSMPQEEVIKRFKEVHGDRYDYSLVEYVNNSTKITIVCNEHGEFLQIPADHKAGKGCRKCGSKNTGKKRLTTELFIARSIETHGNKYDYSQSIYVDAKTKVCICCKEHGSFWQLPFAHFGNKQGCPNCANDKISTRCRLDISHFLKRSKEAHGDRYCYSKSEYNGAGVPVTIICKEHGEFAQTPENHYAGSGCPTCAKYSPKRKITQEEFEDRAHKSHKSFYDYSVSNYTGISTYIDIICPLHGIFSQRAAHHMNGVGCQECAKIRVANSRKLTVEDFIIKAKAVHGDKYTYENVDYKGADKRVNITCRKHGDFSMRPSNLLTGYCCQSCSRESRKLALKLPHTLYVLTWENITKIGITCRAVEERVYEINKDSGVNFKILKQYNNIDRGSCFQMETQMLQILRDNYYQIKDTYDGSTECFEDVNLAWLLNTIETRMSNMIKD